MQHNIRDQFQISMSVYKITEKNVKSRKNRKKKLTKVQTEKNREASKRDLSLVGRFCTPRAGYPNS